MVYQSPPARHWPPNRYRRRDQWESQFLSLRVPPCRDEPDLGAARPDPSRPAASALARSNPITGARMDPHRRFPTGRPPA